MIALLLATAVAGFAAGWLACSAYQDSFDRRAGRRGGYVPRYTGPAPTMPPPKRDDARTSAVPSEPPPTPNVGLPETYGRCRR